MPLQKITKNELIRQSIAVFRRKGYYRTSMSDLANASGLTKGAFYHHFASKEEVMKSCLQATSKWFQDNVFALAYDDDLENEIKLERMSAVIFKAFTKEIGGCFYANTLLETAHVEDTFQSLLKAFFTSWEEAFVYIFKTKYPLKKAKNLSTQMIADMEGSILLMQLHQDMKYLKASVQRCIDFY